MDRILAHYRIFGLADTLKEGLARLALRTRRDAFDRQFGTDTRAVWAPRYDESPPDGVPCRSFPTDPRLIRHLLGGLRLDFREFAFIDFGCGKGRVLLCAAAYPFARIIGVEWSRSLASVAQRNLDTFHVPPGGCSTIEVHCMNVLDFPLPPSNTVLYMYNPFGPRITMEVFRRARESFDMHPRRFLIAVTGIGRLDEEFMSACFDRERFVVLRRCRTLSDSTSWILGEIPEARPARIARPE